MDFSWVNKFSGGLDLVPVICAVFGFALMFKLPKPLSLEERLTRALAFVAFVALPIAQLAWIYAVIHNVPMLGTLFDNVWFIFNLSSVLAIILLLHLKRL